MNFLIRFDLNSIMILLIPVFIGYCTDFFVLFKFHYDSINSINCSKSDLLIRYLNSIMILLILIDTEVESPRWFNLNSIMILLILR